MNTPARAKYTLLAFGSLLVIVDPIATVPAFLVMTPCDTPEQRIRKARLTTVVITAVLLIFAVAEKIIFKCSDWIKQ